MTRILPEYMDDDVAKIHEHPLRGRFSLDVQCTGTRLGQHPIDVIGDGSRLAVRISGTQHQIVGNGGQFRNVEDEDVRGLLVEHGPRNS
jgi:hypothetical protein